ncbi:NAD(P)-dependent oxidoreductase [Catenuloplanes japonicus]|uniref:NAD(P)-dependent oxidoreductase n=1 Tax=Catenuloplanes japonicus TaxID=33876 RepID=UPI000525A48C|nr:NAD(P)H-binding protein [Catenuloplanes japonicus]
MRLTILAASGATGLELTRQALARGHTVTAVARTPARITVPDSPLLTRVAADVRDPASIASALDGVVLSGLGIVGGDLGVLSAGARAAVAAGPERIIWLGAFGTGPSAEAAGAATRTLLKLALGREIPDKVAADALVLEAGGTVFHAGILSAGPLSPARRTIALSDAPKRLVPARVSRATVAAAMLDEAENHAHAGGVALPLER